MPQDRENISNVIAGSSQTDTVSLIAIGVKEFKADVSKNDQSNKHVSSGFYTRCETTNCCFYKMSSIKQLYSPI